MADKESDEGFVGVMTLVAGTENGGGVGTETGAGVGTDTKSMSFEFGAKADFVGLVGTERDRFLLPEMLSGGTSARFGAADVEALLLDRDTESIAGKGRFLFCLREYKCTKPR